MDYIEIEAHSIRIQTRKWQQDNEMLPVSCLLARFDEAELGVVLDEHGDIVGLDYNGVDDLLLMDALSQVASSADDGSWIQFKDSEQNRWRIRYENGQTEVFHPHEIWKSATGKQMEETV